MTEKYDSADKREPSDSELIKRFPLHLELMRQTDPSVLEKRLLKLYPPDSEDRKIVALANEIIIPFYEGKKRKYSDTPAILHAYRVALAGDTSVDTRLQLDFYMISLRISM